jgi:hypothetical protein
MRKVEKAWATIPLTPASLVLGPDGVALTTLPRQGCSLSERVPLRQRLWQNYHIVLL